MTGHYKGVGESYAYQLPLETDGFHLWAAFAHNLYPKGYEFPKSNSGWDMRRSIKAWIVANPEIFHGMEYRITRANGYWRDLHGKYVYEIWVKRR